MPEIKLIEDVGQKINFHTKKNDYWLRHNVEVTRFGLPVGDYVLVNDKIEDVLNRKEARGIAPKKMDFLGTYNICVDTKKDIQELVSDICGRQHERFRDECILAKNNGIQLIVLVENDYQLLSQKNGIANNTIHKLEELHSWINPRLFVYRKGKQAYPQATRGITLQKCCHTMQWKYGVRFEFCSSDEAGARIVELLQEGV
jgi:ribosome-associated protein